jgi:hypothetical protein
VGLWRGDEHAAGADPVASAGAVGQVPRGRWTHATLTAAGLGPSQTCAGAVDRPGFAMVGKRILMPALLPGQIVVRDTLRRD